MSRGLGDVYKRQEMKQPRKPTYSYGERDIQVEAGSKTEQQRYRSSLMERERKIGSERHKYTTREIDIGRQKHPYIERPENLIQRQRQTQR